MNFIIVSDRLYLYSILFIYKGFIYLYFIGLLGVVELQTLFLNQSHLTNS